jgi:leader peptidase (prepilin peptidase)/N-methyltransferase
MAEPGTASAATKWTRVCSLARTLRDRARGVAHRYVVAGGVAAVAMSISVAIAPGPIGVLGAGLALLMVAIAAIDLRSFLIPNHLSAAGFSLALLHALAYEPDAMLWAVMVAVLRGGILALGFFALRSLYARLRGRQGIGLGDVKLAAVAGAWLDWQVLPIAIDIAVAVALASYLLRQILLGRSVSLTQRLPFGFFLAPAIWIGWVWQTVLLMPL